MFLKTEFKLKIKHKISKCSQQPVPACTYYLQVLLDMVCITYSMVHSFDKTFRKDVLSKHITGKKNINKQIFIETICHSSVYFSLLLSFIYLLFTAGFSYHPPSQFQ